MRGTAQRGQRGDNEEGREAFHAQRSNPAAGEGLDALGGAPVDIGKLRCDELLLDALGGPNPEVPARSEDAALAALLLAWRRDVDATPIAELVDMDMAAAAIRQARRPQRLRGSLIPLVSAAAVLVITLTGVGLASRDAQPGDLLWSMEQMLYPGRAQVTQAASLARIDLATANAAFLHGDRVAAEAALQHAQQQMREVDADHGLHDLQATQASLAAAVDNDRSQPTAQPAPAPAAPRQPSVASPPSASAPPTSTASSTSSSAQPKTSSPPSTSTSPETTSSRTRIPAT